MKQMIALVISLIIAGSLLFTTSCKKAESPESSRDKTTASAPQKPAFNPDEPAPVPEGTPPY
ncbi:MAG TPA: hypothetical protein ENG83_04405 [Nitrospirae bacterium]|nr:hypothetical protein BMS3Abin06_00606 [bacterium BMS3Abin06]HDH11433.1 hypothetical protein [Nitrospirota bacterium]HDL21216.1 hypothetical protein [Nitrospirota bacterium]HDZ01413.1 hypothetical protein [Nitrospirota bacterium]